ncbi:DNA-processing protein DprA [Arthrobacter sp. GCM10027362]|uniref:DNA-processing protein DprA n=1 Tax=Arthrobacter sp. GCM10027362 TaxID=3273379 RepID=UPI003633D384
MNAESSRQARRARAALSRLMEPTDWVGLALVAVAGPVDALRIATGELAAGTALQDELAGVLDRGPGKGSGALLAEALQRWAPRVKDLAPDRDLATIARFGGALLVPGDELWPPALADLQLGAPLCLWVRGSFQAGIAPAGRAVALVGSRDSTGYGNAVAGDLAAGLVQQGCCIVSGGAYGIDAQAHRSALAAAEGPGPATVAVMACGLDRYYPAGNEELLRAVADRGLLIAEVPPGAAPTRWRFLQRNRLIAALAGATVVVEARWRSGALNTAHHAAELGRPVGAVPGSVYSANSAGTHRLLRDGSAVCVTGAAEVAELLGPVDAAAGAENGGWQAQPADHDGLGVEDLLLLDALPVRRGVTAERLAVVAGLPVPRVLAGLGRLEIGSLAVQDATGWRRGRRG